MISIYKLLIDAFKRVSETRNLVKARNFEGATLENIVSGILFLMQMKDGENQVGGRIMDDTLEIPKVLAAFIWPGAVRSDPTRSDCVDLRGSLCEEDLKHAKLSSWKEWTDDVYRWLSLFRATNSETVMLASLKKSTSLALTWDRQMVEGHVRGGLGDMPIALNIPPVYKDWAYNVPAGDFFYDFLVKQLNLIN